ncbi:hypothetical protein DYB37_010457 [Aphanomyces astaci]|uniref:Core-binding (CB) domain-containing protein n=1 Tax=Aphanomyces astaci TaxID=112090 RepID=A0A418F1A3_APHAT|nr:hypothetical protein DYB37_010457 [Aphanomyces astaci]
MAEAAREGPLGTNSTRQLSTTVQDLRDNRLAMSSKKGYHSGINQVVIWLHSSGRSNMVNDDGSINLNEFGYAEFTEFVLYKYKHAKVSLSTLSGYRSAIKDYYNRLNVPLPAGFANDATVIFQGIRRLCASETQSGAIKPGGKQPLRHHQYVALCKESLSKFDSGFTHLFLILTWNLMCRSKSTSTVRIDHLTDEGDAIGVTFFKSKTEQGGTKRRNPKHVYANPLRPETCCILALALYLACNTQHDSGNLFPGSAQRDRFGRGLSQLVGDALPAASNSLGTHSLRKVRAQPGEIREAIEQLLEEKGVTAGNITHTMLEKMLKNTVKSIVESSTTSQAQSPHENEECAAFIPVESGIICSSRKKT